MPQGLVIKSTGSWYTVLSNDKIILCRIKGKFRTKGIKTSTPVTVGDRVTFDMIAEDNTGVITKIDARKNYIARKAIQFHHDAHLIAANIDQAFLMVTLKAPTTPFEFIDRFLLSAEMFFIETKILVNKTDLIDKEELDRFINIYTLAGYECIPICVTNKEGIEAVHESMKGKISLISGNSGVGKSSFIHAINPELTIRIDKISEYHQSGKHTTTFSEIFEVTKDCFVIDTPGIRSFGLVDIDKNEIGLYFKDIFHASDKCKFTSCTHIHEPGCMVRKAVEKGLIAESRYRSYVNIFLDDGTKHR
jgi:ribosome biogenesis GTPase / thiamine phosphate phosphatase